MAKDPYELLGVGKTSSDAEIKSAFRKLAKQHHPDLNPNNKQADARFKEINAAYDLLSDKDKRAAFDRGETDMHGQPQPNQQFYRDHAQGSRGSRYYTQGGDSGGADFSDIFSSFFGGGMGGGRQEPAHARYSIEVDFMDAATGGNKRVTMPDGRQLDIHIPAGISDGQQLRLKGQGGKGPKNVAGDALVEIHIRSHPVFTRKGNDIYSDLPVGFQESILGGKVTAQTVHGPVDVTVPKGSSTGAVLRLKGKGIQTGDHYVKLSVCIPRTIDPELEQFMREWSDKHAFNPRTKEAKV